MPILSIFDDLKHHTPRLTPVDMQTTLSSADGGGVRCRFLAI